MSITSKWIYGGSSATINAKFYNDEDVLTSPTGVSYRVRCKTTNTTLRDFTTVSPSSSVDIVLTSDDTEIQTSTNYSEMKSVDVSAFFADGQSTIESYELITRNILLD